MLMNYKTVLRHSAVCS